MGGGGYSTGGVWGLGSPFEGGPYGKDPAILLPGKRSSGTLGFGLGG